jgi:hypothetical protein
MKLPEFCRVAHARLGWPGEELFNTMSHAERAMRDIDLDDREALELICELHDFTDRLESRQHTAKESRAWK